MKHLNLDPLQDWGALAKDLALVLELFTEIPEQASSAKEIYDVNLDLIYLMIVFKVDEKIMILFVHSAYLKVFLQSEPLELLPPEMVLHLF